MTFSRNWKRIALVFGVWSGALVVACTRDVTAPPSRIISALVTPGKQKPQRQSIPPRELSLRHGNVFSCGTVEYVGKDLARRGRDPYKSDQLVLTSLARPAFERKIARDTTGLQRFHYIQWEKGTSQRVFEANCVIPMTREASRFTLDELRKAGKKAYQETYRGNKDVAGNDPTNTAQLSEAASEDATSESTPEASAPSQDDAPFEATVMYESINENTFLPIKPVSATGVQSPDCWWDYFEDYIVCENEVECWPRR